ncbi:MAG: hypothetical protein HY821_17335 [Acidobacteria bacterium]|nr:hypothetical protein [Acidobacteriota bacterium]
MYRRTFLKSAAASPAVPAFAAAPSAQKIDWKARWIWYPERRTISATFVLFRRTLNLSQPPASAQAWVSGHSRYQLWVNGQFLQRGPAPCDPRFWDVDPIDLAPHLRSGKNVIAAVVCAFGAGDGTYVPPCPTGSGEGRGFLFQCDALDLVTDASWKTLRPRCWNHGSYQRWFLRAFQEEFDARAFPEGWAAPEYDDAQWMAPAVHTNAPGRPALREVAREGWRDEWVLQPRTIPAIVESNTVPASVSDTGWIDWLVAPEEYFECFPINGFQETADAALKPNSAQMFPLRVPATGQRSAAITFDFGREVLGHPSVKLRAPAGTVVEILMCEKQVRGKLLLRIPPKYGQWLRVTCKEGITEYTAFEYDCFRQMQLCIRNAAGPVEILAAGVRERNYAYPHEPDFQCSDADVMRAFRASVATQKIVSQETLVDNCVRERQQYAGDLDQAKLGSYYGFGETRQPARMIRTFSQGQNAEGWFMDSWPAWDRCQRLFQKHLGLTTWGPIIDHAMQFGIAVGDHYLWDEDASLIANLTPKMALFDHFLTQNVKPDGLLPVLNWTWNTVWIDHIGFITEEDKHCALNIYWAGMLKHGLARLYDFNQQPEQARKARARAEEILAKVRRIYWSEADGIFVDNLPRRAKDGATRIHARTLSMALLFGAVPIGREARSVELLHSIPVGKGKDVIDLDGGKLKLGINYPLNDIWRLWALAAYGRGDIIVNELKNRWAQMPSVLANGTYSEDWNPQPSESGQIWCQSNPVPMIALYQLILGVQPTAPGFASYDLRPQPGGLQKLSGTVHTTRGPIHVSIDGRKLEWRSPGGVKATLVRADGTRRVMPVSASEQTWQVEL